MWPDSEETISLEPFGEDDKIEDFVFSTDGRYLAGVLRGDAVLIWEMLEGQPRFLFRGESNRVSAYGSTATFSPDNQIVAQSARQFVRRR